MAKKLAKRGLTLGIAVAGLVAARNVLQPIYSRWGATDEELERTYPGDDLSKDAQYSATHAVTIAATPQAIWPWFVQLGQDRAGFYSYAGLENLVGAQMPTVERIVPEFQVERKVGETIPLGSPERFEGQAAQIVASIEPQRSLVLITPGDWANVQAGGIALHGIWAFVLEPLDQYRTRVIARFKLGPHMPALPFVDAVHFIMQRKMLLTLKALIETPPPLSAPPETIPEPAPAV
jgi:hypothetical protein